MAARTGARLNNSSGTPATTSPTAASAGSRVGTRVGTTASPTSSAPATTAAANSPSAAALAAGSAALGARVARRPVAEGTTSTTATTATGSTTSNAEAAARARARIGARTAASRASEAVPAGTDPSAADLTGRASRSAHARRPSQQIVEKEKKTDYWQGVAQEAQRDGSKVNGDDFNNVISRAMTLGIVGDRKQRESLSGPKANELLTQLKDGMEQRLKELGGGQVNTEALMKTNAGLMEKIMGLEKALQTLEKRKTEQEDQERQKLQGKISDLEKSLRELEQQKQDQREQNRKTMKLEIANLKEMMTKVQQEKQTETASSNEAKAMAAKMARLEAALRLMNEERKKKVEDKETLLLKRKLALFEQKFKEMEESKKVQQTEVESNDLRDKLLLMEDKLSKMEKRKSMSMTMAIQQKMEGVEKQMALLRSEQGKGHNDETNAKITLKMKQLEEQLKQLSTQKNVTPAMVNDEETVALRTHVKKLEDAMLATEKKMEDQRKKLEEERKLAYERRLREEEEFRRQAREKEELLIQKINAVEGRIKAGGGGGGGGIDPTLLARLDQLEKNKGGPAAASPEMLDKLKHMEAQLQATQRALESERESTKKLLESPGNGVSLEDIQLEWLKQTNAQLIAKLENTTKMMDKKMEEVKNMAFSMPAGGAVHKSGLTYDEINKKLADLQAKLFDPNTDERESEQLNIEYEKLITELEQTPEYQSEQEKIREKWKKDNAPLNKDAFETVSANLKAMNDNQITTVFKKKPELRLLQRTPDQILKAHENDFKQLSTQMLDLDEARALYHNMPAFRKDQAKQVEWVQQLQQKIEVEASKPKVKAPPPIQATKKVVIKKVEEPADDGGGGGGGFLEELLKKRKKRD